MRKGNCVSSSGSLEDLKKQLAQAQAELRTIQNRLVGSESTNALYRRILDNSPDYLWAKDVDGGYLFANPTVYRTMLGADSLDEVIGKHDLALAEHQRAQHPEDPQWYTFGQNCGDTDALVLTQREARKSEEHGNIGGEFLLLDVYKAPMFDEGGELLGTVGSARAITGERRAEQSYRNIFNSTADTIFVSNKETGEFLDVNDAVETMYGYTPEELIALQPGSLSQGEPPYSVEDARAWVDKALTDGLQNLDWWARRKDGSLFWARVTIRLAVIGGRQTVLSIVKNIDREKRAELERERMYSQFSTVMDSLAALVYVVDSASDKVLFINRKTRERFGPVEGEICWQAFNPGSAEPCAFCTRDQLMEPDGSFNEPVIWDYYEPQTQLWWEMRNRAIEWIDGQAARLIIGTDITQRKEMENDLRETEARFRIMFAKNREVMLLVDPDDSGHIVDANEAATVFYGYPREHLLSMSITDIGTLAGRQERRSAGEKGDESAGYFQFKHRLADGSVRDVEVYSSPLPIKGETYLLAIVHDISQRVADERELHRRFDQLNAIYELSDKVIRALSLDEMYETALQTVTKTTGIQRCSLLLFDEQGEMQFQAWRGISQRYREAVAGHTPWTPEDIDPDPIVIPDVNAEADLRGLLEVFLAERIRGLAFVPLLFDSVVKGKLMLYRSEVDGFSGPELQMVQTIGNQIVAAVVRRRDEMALRRSEMLFRAVIEQSGEGIGMARLDGSLTLANAHFCMISGYDEETLLTMNARELLAPDEEMTLFNKVRRGESGVRRARLQRSDGTLFMTEVRAYPVVLEGEKLVLAMVRDITDQIAAEAEWQQLEAQVQHTQKLESLGILAGGVAHDFNNLLTGILGNAGLAEMELDASSSALPCIRNIEQSSMRAAELCRQLLAYSGRGKFVVRSADMNEEVREMAHLLETSISKKAGLKLELTPDLPLIKADTTQLHQVIMNLIINASDAIGDDAGEIVVTTGVAAVDEEFLQNAYLDEAQVHGDYLCLEVADTGCGMDEETRSRLFDPFFTTKFAGRGLGLAAVLGIVRGHDGIVVIDSELGIGTTFKVLFPCAEEGGKQADPKEAEAEPWSGEGTILVVDDEEPVRSLAKSSLERAGFNVIVAQDGQECVDLFAENRAQIRAVLLDMTMPRKGGPETFGELRSMQPDLPVLLSSGFSEQEAVSILSGEGLAGFLRKPYKPNQLLEGLRAILERPGLDQPDDI